MAQTVTELLSDAMAYVESVKQVSCLDALERAFARQTSHSGVTVRVCGVLPLSSSRNSGINVLIGLLPPEWKRIYDEKRYHLDDPILRCARKSLLPFRWRDALDGPLAGRAAEIMDGRAKFGLRDGLVVPIHTPDHQAAWVHFMGERLDDAPEARYALQLVGFATFIRAAELAAPAPAASPRLTARELECLRWIAAGKSDCDIGHILSISDRTAHFHVENAKRKLDASSRVQAVMTALARNLLQV
jgi:LuxR family transcriptional regulator, quorum-sensing system regulator BjaR1